MISRRFAFISLLTLVACDPYSEAHLCNESGIDLEVTIRIDKDYVEKNWEGHQQARFLKQFASSSELVGVSLDTVTLTGIYKLEKGKCSTVYGGISSRPRLEFNYLKVSSEKNSLIYNSRDEIENAFINEEGGIGGGTDKLIVGNDFNE